MILYICCCKKQKYLSFNVHSFPVMFMRIEIEY